MWIDRLTANRTAAATELAARFAEQRHLVLAENVANVDTPDFQPRELDPAAFERSLTDALQQARESGSTRLDLRGNAQFVTQADGRLHVRPVVAPAQNVLFHDGTNTRLEQLMTDVSKNELYYDLATTLLRRHYDNLLTAIRGRLT